MGVFLRSRCLFIPHTLCLSPWLALKSYDTSRRTCDGLQVAGDSPSSYQIPTTHATWHWVYLADGEATGEPPMNQSPALPLMQWHQIAPPSHLLPEQGPWGRPQWPTAWAGCLGWLALPTSSSSGYLAISGQGRWHQGPSPAPTPE